MRERTARNELRAVKIATDRKTNTQALRSNRSRRRGKQFALEPILQ